jgi:hypothetical protein
MLKTEPSDPADDLDSEEGFAACAADAQDFGPEAVADAVEVVARARARMAASNPARVPPSSDANQRRES